jgi:hypothetical protein
MRRVIPRQSTQWGDPRLIKVCLLVRIGAHAGNTITSRSSALGIRLIGVPSSL